MNEDKLILTENRLLPRLLDILLTVMAWGGRMDFLLYELLDAVKYGNSPSTGSRNHFLLYSVSVSAYSRS